MRFSANRLLPLALAIALAALSFWLDRLVRVEDVHPSLRRHDPDYIIENFLIRNFDAQGIEIGILSGKRMVHYPDDDSTEILAPRVVDQRPGKGRLTLTAGRGQMNQSGEEVFLYDQVQMLRAPFDSAPESRVRTEFLHYVRSRALIRSDREVSVEERGRSLSGRGLEYEHEQRQFRLLGNVRGRFESTR
jgi:lipopolysaccharide export system protein LptC